MKNRTPLLFMEQVVMILVFSLAAAVCVQAFVLSNTISKRSAARDQAVVQAQSAAAVYQKCRGDGQSAARISGGAVKNGSWVIYWDSNWKKTGLKDAAYCLKITPLDSDQKKLGQADVSVTALRKNKSEKLTGFSIAWQEADENE